MKRRLAAVLATFLLAGLFAIIPTSPASAHPDICVGQGTATTPTIYYPGMLGGGPAVGSATLNLVGACVSGHIGPMPGFATVTVTGLNAVGGGYCGHSLGIHGNVQGHEFGYVSAGSMLLINPVVDTGLTVGSTGLNASGSAVGIANAIPDATAGQSCVSGATLFLVTGVVAMV